MLGTPVAVQRGVRNAGGGNTGAALLAVSETGHLAYIPAINFSPAATSALLDVNGRLEPLRLSMRVPRISPVALQIASHEGGAVWIYQGLTNGVPRKLTL